MPGICPDTAKIDEIDAKNLLNERSSATQARVTFDDPTFCFANTEFFSVLSGEISQNVTPHASAREPWNKGKLIGGKPPLRPKHVWSIRTKLQLAGRTRDLAMFNLAIDSKLRG